jgi:hypothetical protein
MQGVQPKPTARQVTVEAMVALEPSGPKQAKSKQAERNNDCAANEVQLVAIREQHLAERCRARSQQHEDCRKAEDKAPA